MGFADYASTKSKDSTKVGAILVAKNGRTVLVTAYNGPPSGVNDSQDRFERPQKYLFASHAENNCISFAAKYGLNTDGCGVYVTHSPCSSCARTLIQAGIKYVVYGEGKTSMPAEEFEAASIMFYEAGVSYTSISEAKRMSK